MEQNVDTMQETENEADIDYAAKLAEIDKALEENARRIAEIDEALAKLDERKIFTLKELREMELQKQREEQERLENEKKQIDDITAASLKEAELLRNSAQTDEEKLIAEYEALNIEWQAILHDLEIRKMILHENESKLEDMFAKFAIEESKFQKNKKASLTASKKSGDYYKLREEMYQIKSSKGMFLDKCRDIAKVVERQTGKIANANCMLRNINEKLHLN